MRFAVLGAGGVGGLLGGLLARDGHEVTLVVRPGGTAAQPERLTVCSEVAGTFSVPLPVVERLAEPVDVVLLATKASALPAALDAAPADLVGPGLVVPFLNGVDHVALLDERYGPDHVCPATIRVETRRAAPGLIEHRLWHTPPDGGAAVLARRDRTGARVDALVGALARAGVPTVATDDEATMLWGKLALQATLGMALALVGTVGAARDDPELWGLVRTGLPQFVAVAAAEGASLDLAVLEAAVAGFDAGSTSSMRRDLEAGIPLELDGQAGPALRAGDRHGLDVGALRELHRRVAAVAPTG